ncbi:MAG: peptide-methionine (S)-S-oxide reductase [Nanohaloarchaea archaeon SW_7_43_1]|nr:MAG: peptide-methionine (S)-S-oxide reductase [Nanohaloarchaea archaeon SW_7_43_1]
MSKLLISLFLILILGIALGSTVNSSVNISEVLETEDQKDSQANTEWRENLDSKEPVEATFAGGCFWCIEAVYENEKGIESAVSGYTGGKESTATYDQVLIGDTDHREAVRVNYYPSVISYEELLDMYWKSINPTDEGGQFSDRGYQYTTAIYTHNDKQYSLAKASKENLSESGKFEEEIVTEVLNASEFYRAESKHQNYSEKNTLQYKAYEQASGRKGFVERVWEKSPIS